MGAFEHVISLLSFVYALAIAHLLTTAARIIGSWERVRFSWIHALWMLNALLILVADWISFWDIRIVPSWTMAAIGVVMIQAFTDYMCAALVCPEIPDEGAIDLIAFHNTRSRRYIGAFTIAAFWALVDNFYFGDNYNVAEFMTQNFAVVPLITVGIAAALFRNRWVQVAAPILMLCVWGYFFSTLQSALK